MGVFFLLTPFVPRLNREWRPEALICARGRGRPGDRRAGVRGRLDAVRRPDARRRSSPPPRPRDSVGHGGVLLAFYSLGLAVPFLLTAVAFDRATTAFRWIRDHYTDRHRRLRRRS